MNLPKQKLVDSITRRLEVEISSQNTVKFLKHLNLEDVADATIQIVYLFTRNTRAKKQTTFAEIIAGIGHEVRNRNKMKRDSALAAKAGGFLLYSLEEMGLISVIKGQGENGHGTYLVEVISEEGLTDLWSTITINKTVKLPSQVPYAPWTTTRHETGAFLVKTANKGVLEALTIESHPIVFNVVNKAQAIGWKINKDVYNLQVWALRNKAAAFDEIWNQQNPTARDSKLREAKSISDIALRFMNQNFYHLYYLDFRGRKYPATAYLHEQGSDLAKGLLLEAEGCELGEQGFDWLCISIASNWAGDAGRLDGRKTDKIPLKDRIEWVLDNEEILLSYAQNPKVNQGWMSADKPWQFIAACFELNNLRNWQYNLFNCRDTEIDSNDLADYMEYFNYVTHLDGFIDGSNNGSQHLSALTKDEITAPHVNLVPLEFPGDLYSYVGEHVWEFINKEVAAALEEDVEKCEEIIDTLTDMKNQIASMPLNSERRKELIAEIIAFKKTNNEIMRKASPVFWARIIDNKYKRKIVKRNIMTLPYGGSAYGLG